MKVTLVLLALAGSVLSNVIEQRWPTPGCNGDNCARAVTGTRVATAVAGHMEDCSSFVNGYV